MKEIRVSPTQVTIVDDWNYAYLSQWNWSIKNGYAKRKFKGKDVFMHRVIMNTPWYFIVDHIDHCKLNNQEHNLRNCTHSENSQNLKCTDKFQGVYWYKQYAKFASQIKVYGESKFIGYYVSEIEAAEAYNRAAYQYFGPGAKVNDIAKVLEYRQEQVKLNEEFAAVMKSFV